MRSFVSMARSILASPRKRSCDRSSQRNFSDDRVQKGSTNGPPWTEETGVWGGDMGGSKHMTRRGRSIRPRPTTLRASPTVSGYSSQISRCAPFPARPPPHPTPSPEHSNVSHTFFPTLDRDPSRKDRVSVRESCRRSNIEPFGDKLTWKARRCRAPHAHERLWHRWKRT